MSKKEDMNRQIRMSSNVLTGWGQVAAYLQVSIQTAQTYAVKKKLPVVHNGCVRALKTELDKWACKVK